MLPQVNNVKYSHEGAVNPSGGNGFILGQNQFLDVHVCKMVCICRRPKGGVAVSSVHLIIESSGW